MRSSEIVQKHISQCEQDMMGSEEWRRLVVAAIGKIADRTYQERTWFGADNRMSSPEELYCELFDDLLYDDFLEAGEIMLSEQQKAQGRVLKQALEDYSAELGDTPDPHLVINDPRWEAIRKAADSFLRVLAQ